MFNDMLNNIKLVIKGWCSLMALEIVPEWMVNFEDEDVAFIKL